jgi:hypothetical protein
MATNIYKFFGKTSTAAETATLLSPSLNETFVIKSIRVTNKSSVNTPTVTIKNNTFEIINTQTLVISTSIELFIFIFTFNIRRGNYFNLYHCWHRNGWSRV